MKNLAALRARLKELTGELQALMEKEGVPDAELAAHKDAIDKKTAEVKAVSGQIESIQAGINALAASAVPANTPVVAAAGAAGAAVVAVPAKKLTVAEKVGFLIAAMVEANRESGRGTRHIIDHLARHQLTDFARDIEAAQVRTLNSTQATAGGVLVPEDMSMEIIDILRPNNTFLQGNPIIIPMPRGTYKMPAAATGATASYRAETAPKAVSNPTFKEINMSAKLLAGIVPISNQLIRWSGPDVAAWARNDLSLAMGTRMDYACFFGDGTADTPIGIFNIPGIFSVASTGGVAPTYAQVDADTRRLLNAMQTNNVPMVGVEWRMNPRVFNYLADLRDGNGNAIYPTLQLPNPTWKGYPVRWTTQFPINGGVTTDESYIALIAFGHIIFGDAMAVQFAISDVATVVNGAQTINSFQDNVTVIRAEMEHDVDTRYPEAIALLTNVRWGG